MKGVKGTLTHGPTMYRIGCRCATCRSGWSTYLRDWRRTQKKGGPKLNAFQLERRRQRATNAAAALGDVCLRCELKGAGAPLCGVCLAELRGERTGRSLTDSEYVNRVAEMYEAHPRIHPYSVEREIEEALTIQLPKLKQAELPPDLWQAWHGNFVCWLESLNALLPVR